jgi:hypothetical protein
MGMHDASVIRRDVLKLAGLGLLGTTGSGWFPALAEQLAQDPGRRRQAILLWMAGGPSQTDTFDMKPDHANGGEFKEASTSVPGLRFSEHLPRLAEQADRLAIVRSLSTREGDHSRATHLVRTGHPPGSSVRYPSIACSLAKELQDDRLDLPSCVSIAPAQQFGPAAFGPGFLGPRYAPAAVGTDGSEPPADGTAYAELKLNNLELPSGIDAAQATRRMRLWQSLQEGFLRERRSSSFTAHNTLYNQAFAMMSGSAREAFDLSAEPTAVRDAYGRGRFGQGCLLARRLIERGVPFVEVTLGDGLGWDTHQDNFTQVRQLSEELDAGWGTLMQELEGRGLLDSTAILWMGEFGRTPRINETAGRDHFPTAWTCVFGGGGIAGGQAYGRTSPDGMAIEENGVEIGDVLATLCAAVGVTPTRENLTEAGRPIRIAEGSRIDAILV